MDSAFDVPDPSDWLGTPVSKLAPVEAALRCQVCKDFFTTPVMTSCSHTFCSLCIRRCLTTDGKCPTCRAEDQELRLRPNWLVQELVDAFQAARPEVLKLGQDVVRYRKEGEQGSKKRSRSLEIMDSDEEEALSEPNTRRKITRSQRKTEISNGTEDDVPIVDGLIACPICHARMKEEDVFAHLDVHNEPESANGGTVTGAPIKGPQPFLEIGSRSRTQPATTMDRLPQLNYSLMNDNSLRKKLTGLGMPTHGPRVLLTRRHTEWVNLVNSNCDSRNPKSRRELLHDLDTWERSQGRQIVNNENVGPSVMDKDFDGAGWASKHDSSFKKLIADAKKKAQSKNNLASKLEEQGSEGVEAEPRTDYENAAEK